MVEILRGASWQAGAQLIPLIVNLIATPYIIHGLGAERYSVYLLVSSLIVILASFDGGIGPATLRYFSLYAGREDREQTTRLLVSVTLTIAALWAVLSAVAVAMVPRTLAFFRLDPALEQETTVLLITLIIMTGPVLVRNVFNCVLFARNRFEMTSVAYVLGNLTFTGGALVSIHQGVGLRGIAVALVVQQLVVTSIAVPTACRYLTRSGVHLVTRAQARDFFGYSSRVQVSGLIQLMTGQKDQIVAGRVLSAQDSGPYGQGTNFAMQLRTLPYNAVGPIQAFIGRSVGSQGPAAAVTTATDIQRLWVRAVTGWCFLGAPAVFFGVQAWLPDSYASAGPVASALLIGHFFPLAVWVMLAWALSLGHARLEMRAGLAGLGVNAVFTVLLGSVFGMAGVVCSTVLAQASAALVLNWSCRRACSVCPPSFMGEIPWLAALIGFAACLGAEWLAHPWFPRGAAGLLTAAATALPAVVLFAALAFSRNDRNRLRRLLHR